MKTHTLPEGWAWVDLRKFVFFQEGPGIRKWQFKKTGIKLLNVGNLVNGALKLDKTERHVDEDEVAQKYSHFLLDPDDIVMASSGVTWGKTSVISKEHLPLMLNTSTIRLRSLDEKRLDKSYLLIFLNSRLFKNQINKLITGSAQPNFGSSHLKQVKLLLPPLSVQREIVAMLEQADAVKRQRQEADALTGALLRSVFYEMFGNPVRNERGWEVMLLEKLSTHIIDCPHSTPEYEKDVTPYSCIRTTELRDGYIDWTQMKYLNENDYIERIRRLTPDEGDIVFGREGSFGVAVRVPKNVKICLGQRVMLFRPNRKKCNSEFLWALLNSDAILHQANQKTSGSTVDHINVTDIKKFKGICPPLPLQQQFANVVHEVDRIREQQAESKMEIDILFDGLMAGVFSGEVVTGNS